MCGSLRVRLLVGALAGASLAGCGLVFVPPLGQHLEFVFDLGRVLARGQKHEVATWTFADTVDTRRRTLQLSGRLGRPEGARLPREIQLVATVTEPPSTRVRQRLRLNAKITPEDRFRVAKKIRRDLAVGSRVEIAVEPVGDDLPAGTRIELCVDLVERRGDLKDFVSCAARGGATTFPEIQQTIFTPSCATAGCHDASAAAAGLVLTEGQAYGALVGVPSSQIFLRQRVDPGKPDDSYLVQKIRGSSTINGGRMPLGGPFLSPTEIAGIVEWIENGAAE